MCYPCVHCGKCETWSLVKPGTCSKCGHQNKPGALVCAECGAVMPLPPGVAAPKPKSDK